MNRMQNYNHWRLETDSNNILWAYFDKQNAHVNTIDISVMEEFNDIVDSLVSDTTHVGVIIASGKKSGFIAGVHISQFTQFKSMNEAVNLLRQGQHIFDKLETLRIPSLALINGFCLGGGLELALACTYRVAEDSSKTRLGLPEVKLGIHPGWGGSVRLPRLIGAPQALNLILSGHTVTGKTAAKLGFVDVVVPERHLIRAAVSTILQKSKPHAPTMLQSLTNSKPMRYLIANYIRYRQLRPKVNFLHYPSPYQVLENWERFGVEGDTPMEREARTCGKLFFSETCHNLVRIFFLQERLKNLAKESKFKPQHVHVIGAGTMGGDIAAWCAQQGLTVTLQDREPKLIAPAIKRAYNLFKEKFKENYLIQKAMDRLSPDVEGRGIAKADIIIEAIYEDLAAKQKIFSDVEAKAKPDAILATNTSSIPLDEINTILKNPSRLVGIHYFNPVAKMQLVEVVKGKVTDSKVYESAMSFVRRIDRLPLPVKSSPGFLVNRILMPYLLEAVLMLDEGIPPAVIDKAMLEFGMPMGPVTLADTVGLDICLSVAKHLSQYFPSSPIPQRLVSFVERGKLGKKTGEGFYVYKNRQQVKTSTSYDKPLTEISDRLVGKMLNECFACLHEGIVSDADLIDAGMIFGTGFAPFRGGPMKYAKSHGINELFQKYVEEQEARGEKVEVARWEITEKY